MNTIIKIVLFFAGLMGVAALSACHETPKPPDQSRMTVLVYQVANNNLGTSGYDQADIKEMVEGVRYGAFAPLGGRLLVFNAGPKGDAHLLDIVPEGIDTLKSYSQEQLAVTSRRMLEVLADVEHFAPAHNYGLVLWSHGSGWLQDGIAEQPTITEKSFGSDRGRTMNISTLAAVLEQAMPLSFIYFDCCYMASVETAYELRNVTPYIVGSATELQLEGMPYDENLKYFYDSAGPRLVDAAATTFNYYDKFSGTSRTATMSVINTAGLDELADATAAIFAQTPVPVVDGFEPQRFMNKGVSSCTYFDFAHYVRSLTSDPALLARFNSALDKTIVYAAATPMLWNTVPLTYHCGLSTYILRTQDSTTEKNYNTLQWYADVASHLPLQ